MCIVAELPAEPGRLAAEARYVPMGDGVAELAITIGDSYQGAGLGQRLLRALVESAAADGIERLRAVVSISNARMLHLLVPFGWVLAEPTDSAAIAYLEISTQGGMPGWPADSAGRRVLVEERGWFGNARAAGLRSAGDDVRQCLGPSRRAGRSCPLLTTGQCQLAEQADLIVAGLPAGDEDCAAVLAAHRRDRPGRLAG